MKARVHPRVCGETIFASRDGQLLLGPSPRVRGNRWVIPSFSEPSGSIPACAGKPCSGFRSSLCSWVHPRVCGETMMAIGAMKLASGPSPRVRGNLHGGGDALRDAGSIPACAGKPPVPSGGTSTAEVHPRVCGETSSPMDSSQRLNGPSPRVRGNPERGGVRRTDEGSIPACAGKPGCCPSPPAPAGVHPRVCGETRSVLGEVVNISGPSPRVRGNRRSGRRYRGGRGSIPACAGKPPVASGGTATAEVHPRVCGETRLGG